MGYSLAVRRLGRPPVTCNARPLLIAAHGYLQRGLYVDSGCRILEAARLFLSAECTYQGCLPNLRSELSPQLLAAALQNVGVLDPGCSQWMAEIIEISGKAARLAFVEPILIETAIALMHAFLDGSPYLVQPMAGGRV